MNEIKNMNDAVEIIANKLQQLGFRKTKLKNYGYYSFMVKNSYYHDQIKNTFENDELFEFTVLNSWVEYLIKVKNKDFYFYFTLKYESTKQNSKIVLSGHIGD